MNAALASKSTKKPSEARKRSSKTAAQTEESVTKTSQFSRSCQSIDGSNPKRENLGPVGTLALPGPS